jgi:hypothetical protein
MAVYRTNECGRRLFLPLQEIPAAPISALASPRLLQGEGYCLPWLRQAGELRMVSTRFAVLGNKDPLNSRDCMQLSDVYTSPHLSCSAEAVI